MSPRGVGTVDGLLADRYRLVESIAVGGMGEVWRGEDVLLGRPVAVKTLKPEYLGDADFRARFRAEARHAGRLAHPGIASVYDFGETESSAWLVMELVEGEPLSSLLRREGPLSVDRTLDLVAQTADALHAAHEGGVVHRDVKPGNLLVRADGVLKVTDFGIASATDAVPLTRTGTVVGTAYYLSPEQAAGRSGSPASDVYALGVVAYECLSGRRPFPGDNPVAVALAHLRETPPPLRSSVPGPVQELVLRALAKDPADRFADAADLSRRASALRAALEGGPWSDDEEGGLAGVPVTPPTAARAPHEDVLLTSAPTSLLDIPAVPEPRHAPGSRSRSSRRAVSVVGALLLVLALGLGVRAQSPDLATETAAGTTATSSPVPSPIPVRVAVDPATYLGLPAVEARAALADQGLVPRLSYDGSGQPVGTVSAVEPSGPLALGTAVLLRVVPELPPAPVEVVAPAPAPVQEPAVDTDKVLPPAVTDKGKSKGKK